MIVIVDASIAAKWFFGEEYSEVTLNLLDNPFDLHAPEFFFLEMDSILCKRTRRRELSQLEALEIHDEMRSIPIKSYHTSDLQERAFEMALMAGQSIYDCIYLALAEALEGRMVTADRRFFLALQGSPLEDYVLWIEDLAREKDQEKQKV